MRRAFNVVQKLG